LIRLRQGYGGLGALLIVALGFVLCASATAGAQGLRRPRVDVTPLVAQDVIPAGNTANAALKVQLPEKLHANSNKPRDKSLIPTVLTVEAPAGVTVEEIVYPQPTDLKQEGQPQPLSVFEREFVIGVRIKVAPGTPAGDLVVPGRLRYQACDETLCYVPATVQFNWPLRIGAPGATAKAQHAEVFKAIRFGTGEAPPAEAPPPTRDPVTTATASADPLTTLDRFETLSVEGGYLDTDAFLKFIRNAETGVKEQGWFEGRGAVAILLIVLVGGLALNLTPCVLPMIPINLAIIGAGAQSGSRKRGFLLGATYGGAMAFVYGALGLIVILTTGTFGAINASPWFNVGIALLFIALALAMFDVFEIDFSRFASGFRASESSRGTFVLAFSMGAIAALLAGACVAPVVIQVVLFSTDLYASGVTAALALPFLLGLGMAIPWPIAGAGIAALPKPGPWMVRVKQVFGVFILAMALYYGYLAYGLFSARWVDAAEVQSSVEQMLKEGWHSDLAAGLAAAEREGKPVLIDFWATWCKSCLTMDRTTLKDAKVTEALSNYVKIKYQAESPDEEPAAALMQRFNAVGLPTYVILKPKTGF
jgi:thiol:disulfide interchange protein